MQIVPGILTDDVELFEKQLQLCMGAVKRNLIEWVQVDFIDGVYADNLTIRPSEVPVTQFPNLKFEAHLMVSAKQNFHQWIEEAIAAGFARIMPQVESLSMTQKEFVDWMQSVKCQAALSIDAESPVSVIEEKVLSDLAVVQVMTIKAGFSGQEMKSELMNKVRELVVLRKRLGLDFLIEVDGGVHLETIQDVKEAGADLAEVNSGLFREGKFEENLEKLKHFGSGQRH